MKITLDLPDDAGFAILSVIHGNNKVTTLHLNGAQIKYSKTVKIKDDGANSFPYCPNCGARMRQAKRGKVRRKYGEILTLYQYCVQAGMDVRLERLHDGWAIRFPNGGDFAQHAGTYGTNDGFVEPAIGCEADYSPVSLREAEKLICENRERLVTPSCEGERGMEGE